MKDFKLLTKNDLKLVRGILVFIILVFIFLYLFIFITKSRRNEIIAYWYCENNLKRINQAILIYADKHDGEMPVSSTWADLILEENRLVFKEDFVTPASWSSWGICYNKSLENKLFSDLKEETVVLFTADKRWNAVGDKAFFYNNSVNKKRSYLITLIGDVYRYNPKNRNFVRLKDNQEFVSDTFYWE